MILSIISSFIKMLTEFQGCFTKPSFELFKDMAVAWLQTSGRKTVANIVRTMGKHAKKSHDAYQNFFSKNVWDPNEVTKHLFGMIVVKLCPSGLIELVGDDTLVKHTGCKIFGVSIYRDAVRSSKKKVAYSLGHNWITLAVVKKIPLLRNMYIAFPLCSRLRHREQDQNRKTKRTINRKIDKTMLKLMKEMVEMVAGFAPQRKFRLITDGAYAPLAGQLPSNIHLVARIRKDAKIFDLPAHQEHRRGRRRKKGDRLPSPQNIARQATFVPVSVEIYGQTCQLLVFSRVVLWYHVCKDRPVRLFIVRDPQGKYEDQYFFSDDVTISAQQTIEAIGSRWSIEVMHRELKQHTGIEQPQARKDKAVLRQVPFAMLLLSLIKLWYIFEAQESDPLKNCRDPWYEHKLGISTGDMIASFRYAAWDERILAHSHFTPNQHKNVSHLLQLIARAHLS